MSLFSPRSYIIALFLLIIQETTQQDVTLGPGQKEVSLIEREVLGFRLWMIMGLVLAGLLTIMVVLCCVMDCRIPRTKQEIEADHERKALINKYKAHIDTQMGLGRKLKVMRAKPRKLQKGPNIQELTGDPNISVISGDMSEVASNPADIIQAKKYNYSNIGSTLTKPAQSSLARSMAAIRVSELMTSNFKKAVLMAKSRPLET